MSGQLDGYWREVYQEERKKEDRELDDWEGFEAVRVVTGKEQ